MNAASINGFTALAVACQYGAAEVAQELLASRADMNVQALNGRTPLMLAATFGHTAIVKMLLTLRAAVPLFCSTAREASKLRLMSHTAAIQSSDRAVLRT